MATIKAECPTCGPVRLRAPDLTVRVCAQDDRHTYRFRCPQCSMTAVHEATPAIAALLVSVGIDEELWQLPAELTEQRPDGPAFTPDDELDFHLLLDSEQWQGRLLGDGAHGRS